VIQDRPVTSSILRGGRPSVQAARWAGLLTAAAAVFIVVEPGQFQIALVVWAILMGVIMLAYAAAVMLHHIPLQTIPRRDVELPVLRRYHRERDVAPGLREMERMVIFGQASAYDFETRLRPRLVAIAEHRLATHGLSLTSSPDRVKALVGQDAWELVRPDYQPVGDKRGYGVPWPRLARAVEGLDVH
jgi:hypothetical protein